MVQQDVIDYIRTGKERGYSVNLLKSKLLENGFTMAEVNEAVDIVERSSIEKSKPVFPTEINYFKKDEGPEEKKPEMKKLDGKKSNSSMGNVDTRKLKLAGYSGFILLGLVVLIAALGVFSGFLTGFGVDSVDAGLLSSLNITLVIAILFLVLVVGILGFFHFLGYARLGNLKGSKGLNVTTWAILISGIVTILAMIVIFIIVFVQINGILNGGEDQFGAMFDLISKIFAYSSIVMILSFITLLLVIVFSIFLMKIKGVRFSLVAGIFYLLLGLLGAFSYGVLGYVLLYPGSLITGSINGGIAGLLGFIGSVYYMIGFIIVIIGAFVFGSLALLDASRGSGETIKTNFG